MMTGVLAVALLVPGRGADGLWLVPGAAAALAGLGGGGVVSPNFTLSLAEVPPEMGGAAGGALQTGQRIGSSIGAALLMTVYQLTLGTTSTPGRALQAALLTALAVLAVALAMAVRALRRPRNAAAGCGRSATESPADRGFPRPLEDGAGGVRRGLGVAPDDRRDPAYDRLAPGRPRRR